MKPNLEEAELGGEDDDERLSINSILKSSDDSCEGLGPDAIFLKHGCTSRSQSRAGANSSLSPSHHSHQVTSRLERGYEPRPSRYGEIEDWKGYKNILR